MITHKVFRRETTPKYNHSFKLLMGIYGSSFKETYEKLTKRINNEIQYGTKPHNIQYEIRKLDSRGNFIDNVRFRIIMKNNKKKLTRVSIA